MAGCGPAPAARPLRDGSVSQNPQDSALPPGPGRANCAQPNLPLPVVGLSSRCLQKRQRSVTRAGRIPERFQGLGRSAQKTSRAGAPRGIPRRQPRSRGVVDRLVHRSCWQPGRCRRDGSGRAAQGPRPIDAPALVGVVQRIPEIVAALEVQPEVGAGAEHPRQNERRRRRDVAPVVAECVDLAALHAHRLGKRRLGQAHRLHELLDEDFRDGGGLAAGHQIQSILTGSFTSVEVRETANIEEIL